MLLAVLQGVGGATVVIWALGCVVLWSRYGDSSPRPRLWAFFVPFWPLFVTDEILVWRRREREKRALLDALRRKP